jgi:hypothetical protein
MYQKIAAIMLSFLCMKSIAQDLPRWAEYGFRTKVYPLSRYYTGFSSESYNKGDNIEELKKRVTYYAKQLLAESIKTQIQSTSIIEIANINTQTTESYKKVSSFNTNINLTNVMGDSYLDEKNKIFYAFAYVKRDDIIQNNKDIIDNLLIKTGAVLDNTTVKDWETDPATFKNNIALCNTNLSQIEESQNVLTWMGINDVVDLKTLETEALRNNIKEKLNAIKSKPHPSLKSLCNQLATAYAATRNVEGNMLSISNFTYQNTNLPSAFSDILSQELMHAFTQHGNCKVVGNGAQAERQHRDSLLVLSGTFWLENNQVKINANIREQSSESIVFSMSENIDKALLDTLNYEIRPPELVQKLAMLKKFSESEIVGSNLFVEVWTNKGDQNLIFKHREILKISIRTNKECYLRFIYHLADGNQVLLLDNYYIATKDANKVIELPYEFECIEPFGVEVLQLNAQSKEFAPLRTREVGPYKIILNSLDETLSKTRGFAISENTDLKAEKRLVLTTIGQ